MEISASAVKELRERTGVGIMDCKSALREADGDMDEAIKILRTVGKAKAAARAGREASEGRIESYVHMGGRIAVLLQLNCETDFVARSDEFVALARDLAMHVAAANPRYVRREDVDASVAEAEADLFRQQAVTEGKPEKILDKIVEGKLKRFYSETCLYEQAFVKDTDRNISDLISDAVAKIGENIMVGRFARFALGDPDTTLAQTSPGVSKEPDSDKPDAAE